MVKFTLKISDNGKGSCKVDLTSPKKEEFEKAKDTEKACAIMIQQKLNKCLEDLEKEI